MKLSFPLPETCSFQVWNSTLPFLLNPSASESLSAVTSIARHLQTTIFGTISCTGLVVNFRFPLTYGLPCYFAHDRFFFSSVSNGGKLSNPVSLRNSCFVGINNKPPSLRPSGFVILLRRGLGLLPPASFLNEGICIYCFQTVVLVYRQCYAGRLNFDYL